MAPYGAASGTGFDPHEFVPDYIDTITADGIEQVHESGGVGVFLLGVAVSRVVRHRALMLNYTVGLRCA